MEAKKIPERSFSKDDHPNELRAITDDDISNLFNESRAHNDNLSGEIAVQNREQERARVRRALEAKSGDEVMSRSVIIPTQAQMDGGMRKKPHSIEENDIEYIRNKFPIGSEINLDLAHKEVRAFVVDIKEKEGGEGIYLRLFFVNTDPVGKFKGYQWTDEEAKYLIKSNKNLSGIEKAIMDQEQVKSILGRISSGEIKEFKV